MKSLTRGPTRNAATTATTNQGKPTGHRLAAYQKTNAVRRYGTAIATPINATMGWTKTASKATTGRTVAAAMVHTFSLLADVTMTVNQDAAMAWVATKP